MTNEQELKAFIEETLDNEQDLLELNLHEYDI